MDHFGPPGEEMIKFFEINENFREKHDIYVILYRGVTTKSELEKYVQHIIKTRNTYLSTAKKK